MTIEERAEEKYQYYTEKLGVKIVDAQKKLMYYAYVEGAKEQKQIDQRLLDQANEDGELLAYNCEKKGRREMIDKACEWLKSKEVFCYAGQYNRNEVSESEFRKAMKG